MDDVRTNMYVFVFVFTCFKYGLNVLELRHVPFLATARNLKLRLLNWKGPWCLIHTHTLTCVHIRVRVQYITCWFLVVACRVLCVFLLLLHCRDCSPKPPHCFQLVNVRMCACVCALYADVLSLHVPSKSNWDRRGNCFESLLVFKLLLACFGSSFTLFDSTCILTISHTHMCK